MTTHLSLTLHLLRAAATDLTSRARRVPHREGAGSGDAGLSTLEVVVIALGLFLVAGVLVAAITAAVTSRLAQIN